MIHMGIFTDEISQDFEEAVRVAKENGLDHLEIRNVWGKNVSELSRDEIARVRKIVKDYGVQVAIVGSPFLKCSMADYDVHMKFLDKLIYECHQWETPLIRSFAINRVEPIEEHWSEFIEKMRAPVKKAEEESVVFAIEFGHNSHIEDFEEARKLVDDLPSDSLKFTWHIRGEYQPEKYPLVRGHIAHLHISDSVKDASSPRGRRKAYVGDGDMPFRTIFRVLLKDGYDGTASLEVGAVHWKDAGPDVIPRCAKNLAAIIKDVQGSL